MRTLLVIEGAAHGVEPKAGKMSQPVEHSHAESREVTLFLCGDVMTGRGIDQILPQRLFVCEAERNKDWVSAPAGALAAGLLGKRRWSFLW